MALVLNMVLVDCCLKLLLHMCTQGGVVPVVLNGHTEQHVDTTICLFVQGGTRVVKPGDTTMKGVDNLSGSRV